MIHRREGLLVRPSWDDYFIALAQSVALRATCKRAMVGCVLVRDHRILSTGYNGAAEGEAHCSDVGHLMIDGHCQRALHAERNAIRLSWVTPEGATAYCTHFPCLKCTVALVAAGIVRVVYFHSYRINPVALAMLHVAGIAVEEYGNVRN